MSRRCETLHKYFNNMERFTFPFEENKIPKNGIYILFEKGEQAHGGDRIVRVGTHTGDNQLRSRLKQHFIKENKDRSIFRKNIGRSILNKREDSYLELWDLDLMSRKNREKYENIIDPKYQAKIEKEITEIIQNNFSFTIFEIVEKEDRLYFESKLVSEISNCQDCWPSKNWLGNYSTKPKIRQSGL